MINKIDIKSFESESNEEINVVSLFIKLKRNILLILSIVFLATIYSIFYASNKEPIYKGEFQILVKDDKKEENSDALPSLINQVVPLKLGGNATQKITQKIILKSPLVLRPVYEFTKTEYIKRNEDISNLTYKKWIKRNLNLVFLGEGSDVLQLTFKDKDKKLILSTLKMISENYQLYSKRDHIKNLNKELDYLKNQEIIYTKKYEESFKKYRDFVIENNLYSGNSEPQSSSFTSNPYFENLTPIKPQFSDQFSLLEEYQANRTRYSTKLKPNSEYLKELDSQISKLKKSTKKPNEILLKRENLSKAMLRDEMTLDNLKKQIISSELAIAKQKDPWELILTPTVDEQKVSPNKKNIVLSFFLVSIIVSCFISLIKEYLYGSVDDLDTIKSNLNANFLNVISLDDDISGRILDVNISKVQDDKKNKNSIGNIGFYYSKTNTIITNYINSNKDIKYIDIFESNQIKDFQNIFIFIESGKINNKEINKINKYLELYPDKDFYWIYVENEKLF